MRVFKSHSRAAAVLAGVTIVIAGPAAAAAASVPTLPISPAHGGPRTTFVMRLPAAVLRRADPDADLNVQIIPPPGSRRRCTPLRLPNAHLSGHGRSRVARFVLAPTLFAGRGRGWCPGTYRLLAYAETIVDDDEETGAGGTDDVDLGRARFHVRDSAA